MFDTVQPLSNAKVRVPVCGLNAAYNAAELPPGPDQLGLPVAMLLRKRTRMQGFIVFDDYRPCWSEFAGAMGEWVQENKVNARELIVFGIENAPEAFIGLPHGKKLRQAGHSSCPRMSVSFARPGPSGDHAEAALRGLRRLLQGFAGRASLRLWNDNSCNLGKGPPAFTLVLRDPMQLRSLVTARGPVLMADAYFRGQIDVEGDLYSALPLKGHFEGLSLPWRDNLAMLLDAWRLTSRADPVTVGTLQTRLAQRFSGEQTWRFDRQAIAFHDDVSNDFYSLWLDKERVYSCAYFKTAEETESGAAGQARTHPSRCAVKPTLVLWLMTTLQRVIPRFAHPSSGTWRLAPAENDASPARVAP